MRITPKSEKEIAEAGLWAEGTYEFEIVDAEDYVSKTSGREMIKLSVKLHRDDGATMMVDDYLMDGERTAYKIRHFAEAVGMLPAYERGNLDPRDMLNRAGQCKVRIQKDKSGQFPDKNGITDYVKPTGSAAAAPVQRQRQPAPAGDIDDEIPF